MTQNMISENEIAKAVHKELGSFFQREQLEKLKNYEYLNRHIVKGQILFTGSSLMEQFPVAELARSQGIEKLIYNRGIGGYTTDDFLSHINTVLFDVSPSKLFINIGTNDIRERNDGTDWRSHLLSNYDLILTQIQDRLPDTIVYMMAYYPVNPLVAQDGFMQQTLKVRTNKNIKESNDALQKLAQKHNYLFLDVNDGLYDDDGNLKAEYTKEGLHMYSNGYEVVFQNLKSYL